MKLLKHQILCHCVLVIYPLLPLLFLPSFLSITFSRLLQGLMRNRKFTYIAFKSLALLLVLIGVDVVSLTVRLYVMTCCKYINIYLLHRKNYNFHGTFNKWGQAISFFTSNLLMPFPDKLIMSFVIIFSYPMKHACLPD